MRFEVLSSREASSFESVIVIMFFDRDPELSFFGSRVPAAILTFVEGGAGRDAPCLDVFPCCAMSITSAFEAGRPAKTDLWCWRAIS